MKKFFVLTLFVIFLFSSCSNEQQSKVTTKTTTTIKTTVTEPGTDGFIISKEIVVKGNTIWGFSEKVYGTGFQWRDIVSQNPFLQKPGRVYYDEARGMWIVKIYPGEVVKVGKEIVSPPSYTVEETLIKTEVTNPETTSSLIFNDWVLGFILVFILITLLFWLFFYYRRPANNSSSSSSSNVHVDIHGNDIDEDTLLAVRVRNIQRQQFLLEDIWDDSYRILKKSAKNNSLKSFTVALEEGGLLMNANFGRVTEEKNKKKKDKK